MMKRTMICLLTVLVVGGCARERAEPVSGVPTLVIHGGAGTILREEMTPELEKAYRDALAEALRTGLGVLEAGGSSLDAVTDVIRLMEDSELFNAGKGAVFTAKGNNEMDASIMDGATGMAGAVASVTTIKNPILAARAVMEQTRHVMLAGRGAEIFAAEQGLDIVDPSYFFTQRRWEQLLKKREAAKADEHGTVGVVALDRNGNLAAGTSTGGLTNKMHGRVGDSPIVGAGTYADNETCGVSGTGTGEFFMRGMIAYDVSARMRFLGMTAGDAARAVVQERLTDKNGTGGIIVLDKDGNVAMEFNTPGMYRGYIRSGGTQQVFIYGDE
jgi:beta-aspartyl-peptidase (threonine type)